MVKPKLLLPFVIIGALMVLWGLASNAPVSAAPLAQETEQYCLSCHGNPDLKTTLPSGEELSLYISADHLKSSVHSPAGIECEACHTNIKTIRTSRSSFRRSASCLDRIIKLARSATRPTTKKHRTACTPRPPPPAT